ncbi:hypothetical protein [Microbulbifer sp.]|uniref:hypothetical protein n=1 Tax=Microbulbifer sp. TaxID=1908541 RepID=UPI002589AD90|nr:hypothetical protein [Microbulbifer sp.]
MNLQQIDVTGCRIIGAIDRNLGHSGPKHHGVILGKSIIDGLVYIAESMHFGYQVCTYPEFYDRYARNGEIVVEPNDGSRENLAVAQHALNELAAGGRGKYNLLTNNCECFVNRAIHGESFSSQVINTALGAIALAGLVYIIKNAE